MMPAPLRLAFFSCLTFFLVTIFGCTPPTAALQQSTEVEPNSARSAHPVFAIPEIGSGDSASPLKFWISDLTQPKLLANRALSIECDPLLPNLILIKFPVSTPKCPEVLGLNHGVLKDSATLSCLDAHTLKIAGLKTPCSYRDERILGALKDSPSNALYARDPHLVQQLLPNPALPIAARTALPTLLESKESRLVSEAPINLWLEKSSQSGGGVLALDLNIASGSSLKPLLGQSPIEGLQTLKTQLLASPKPKKLAALPLELILPPWNSMTHALTPSTKTDLRPSPFFFIVSKFPSNPLLRDTCKYISDWIHSEQLLRLNTLTINSSLKKIPLHCSFRLADELPKLPGLRVCEFPLPLISTSKKLFLIKSLDELRSVAVLQSFRVLK